MREYLANVTEGLIEETDTMSRITCSLPTALVLIKPPKCKRMHRRHCYNEALQSFKTCQMREKSSTCHSYTFTNREFNDVAQKPRNQIRYLKFPDDRAGAHLDLPVGWRAIVNIKH